MEQLHTSYWIVNKSKRVCEAIKHTVGYHAPSNVKLKMHKCLCKPNLELSSVVSSPHLKQDIKSLESIQRCMIMYFMGYNEINYDKRCKCLAVFTFVKQEGGTRPCVSVIIIIIIIIITQGVSLSLRRNPSLHACPQLPVSRNVTPGRSNILD